MPRPKKCRNVCHFPRALAFVPVDSAGEDDETILTLDEYETIRLIDREGYSQEECGEHMRIARTTVKLVYTAARKNWLTLWWRDFRSALKAVITRSATEGEVFTGAADVSNTGSVSNIRNQVETRL